MHTSTHKQQPGDVDRRIAVGEGMANGKVVGQKVKKKTGSAVVLMDKLAYLSADCAFITELMPIIACTISDSCKDPRTVNEVQSRSDWPLWQQVMDRKMKMLQDTGTWETVPCPTGSKWVIQIKHKANGDIDKYKAHLVARGFTQIYSTDYFKTYSPVAKLSSLCTILMLAAHEDWDINCFDFDIAYLNGKLGKDKDIYMKNPPGYNKDDSTVKHLKKSLYGLKQAGHKLYDMLKCTLTNLGFCVSNADPGVFHACNRDHPTIIAIHVDDCTITSSSAELVQDYKWKINLRHSITDLGPIHWLLGIKVTQD